MKNLQGLKGLNTRVKERTKGGEKKAKEEKERSKRGKRKVEKELLKEEKKDGEI